MRRLFSLSLALVVLVLIGCASRPKYTLEKHNIYSAKGRIPFRVAVAVFTDERPSEERTMEERRKQVGAEKEEELDSYTYDEDFVDGQVAEPLTEMTAKHLEAAGVFAEVDLIKVPAHEVTPERVKNGEFKAYDAVLVGRMTHMWGYMYKSMARNLIFFPMGGTGLTLNTVIPAPIKGHAQLADIRLLSTKDGQVLWQGEVEAKVETDKMFNDTKRMTAMSLWRKMVNALSEKLEQAAPTIRQ